MAEPSRTSRWLSGSLGQKLKEPLRALFERLGYDIVPLERAEHEIFIGVMACHRIDLVLDVGANQGQYARRLRTLGFQGRIVSMEPGRDAFALLERRAGRDPLWDAKRLALGERSERLELRVSENSVSSSLLDVGDRHLAAAPDSRTTKSEAVQVEPLDSLDVGGQRILLKIDTQGYELPVLHGAGGTLSRCRVLQLEVSLARLYDGQTDYIRLLEHVRDLGFNVVNLLPGFREATTGQLLQFDLLAERPQPDQPPRQAVEPGRVP